MRELLGSMAFGGVSRERTAIRIQVRAYSGKQLDFMKLYMMRHGETAWNAENRILGSTDIPLNEKGREQARAAAEKSKWQWVGAVATLFGAVAAMTIYVLALLGIW